MARFIWLAHLAIGVLFVALLAASFVRYHCRRRRKQLRREDNALAKELHKRMLRNRRMVQTATAMDYGGVSAGSVSELRVHSYNYTSVMGTGVAAVEMDRDCSNFSSGAAAHQQPIGRSRSPERPIRGGINLILANFRSRGGSGMHSDT